MAGYKFVNVVFVISWPATMWGLAIVMVHVVCLSVRMPHANNHNHAARHDDKPRHGEIQLGVFGLKLCPQCKGAVSVLLIANRRAGS